jgi:hypothetical protein
MQDVVKTTIRPAWRHVKDPFCITSSIGARTAIRTEASRKNSPSHRAISVRVRASISQRSSIRTTDASGPTLRLPNKTRMQSQDLGRYYPTRRCFCTADGYLMQSAARLSRNKYPFLRLRRPDLTVRHVDRSAATCMTINPRSLALSGRSIPRLRHDHVAAESRGTAGAGLPPHR